MEFINNETVQIVLLILVGAYEVVVRYVPTVKDVSILSKIISLIKFIVPNRSATSVKHKN